MLASALRQDAVPYSGQNQDSEAKSSCVSVRGWQPVTAATQVLASQPLVPPQLL